MVVSLGKNIESDGSRLSAVYSDLYKKMNHAYKWNYTKITYPDTYVSSLGNISDSRTPTANILSSVSSSEGYFINNLLPKYGRNPSYINQYGQLCVKPMDEALQVFINIRSLVSDPTSIRLFACSVQYYQNYVLFVADNKLYYYVYYKYNTTSTTYGTINTSGVLDSSRNYNENTVIRMYNYSNSFSYFYVLVGNELLTVKMAITSPSTANPTLSNTITVVRSDVRFLNCWDTNAYAYNYIITTDNKWIIYNTESVYSQGQFNKTIVDAKNNYILTNESPYNLYVFNYSSSSTGYLTSIKTLNPIVRIHAADVSSYNIGIAYDEYNNAYTNFSSTNSYTMLPTLKNCNPDAVISGPFVVSDSKLYIINRAEGSYIKQVFTEVNNPTNVMSALTNVYYSSTSTYQLVTMNSGDTVTTSENVYTTTRPAVGDNAYLSTEDPTLSRTITGVYSNSIKDNLYTYTPVNSDEYFKFIPGETQSKTILTSELLNAIKPDSQ